MFKSHFDLQPPPDHLKAHWIMLKNIYKYWVPPKKPAEGPTDAESHSHLDSNAPDDPPDDPSEGNDNDHHLPREPDIPEENEGVQEGPDGVVEDVDLPGLGDYSSDYSSAKSEMEEYFVINLSSWARDVYSYGIKEREEMEQEWVRDAENIVSKANQEELYEDVTWQISQGHMTV